MRKPSRKEWSDEERVERIREPEEDLLLRQRRSPGISELLILPRGKETAVIGSRECACQKSAKTGEKKKLSLLLKSISPAS